MKLNPDCTRNILLSVEKVSAVGVFPMYVYDARVPCPPQGIAIEISEEYNIEEIMYHIRQCFLCDLFYGYKEFSGMCQITDLSPAGHEFLANTRKNEIWGKTKTIASKIGCVSLDALIKISSNVISELIKSEFGIK